ncbi:MAG: hypothetical protein HC867_02145 [Bacteroidia bacterium]|nr:hypothetical protein [Bacteroidia bacterium]
MEITEDVFFRFHPSTTKVKDEICIFCYSNTKITREHVLPKWLFEKSTKTLFISSVNKQTQTYNKAVIPTCSACNNSILSHIENHIIQVIHRLGKAKVYRDDDLSDIVRWMEILDYKLQVYDCRRKYIKYGNSEYDYNWGIFPVAMMRHFIDMDPFKAHDFLRRSQRRITVKAKTDRLNSLVVFNTAKPHFNFFIQPDEYIFVSLPMFKFAFFYFLKKKYNHHIEASEEALFIMEKVFNS